MSVFLYMILSIHKAGSDIWFGVTYQLGRLRIPHRKTEIDF